MDRGHNKDFHLAESCLGFFTLHACDSDVCVYNNKNITNVNVQGLESF